MLWIYNIVIDHLAWKLHCVDIENENKIENEIYNRKYAVNMSFVWGICSYRNKINTRVCLKFDLPCVICVSIKHWSIYTLHVTTVRYIYAFPFHVQYEETQKSSAIFLYVNFINFDVFCDNLYNITCEKLCMQCSCINMNKCVK